MKTCSRTGPCCGARRGRDRRRVMEADVAITCPHCWQAFEVRLDLSAGGQTLIQDCEVCCNPLEIEFAVAGSEITALEVRPIGQ